MEGERFNYEQQAISNVAQWDSTTFGSQIELIQLSPGKFCCHQQVLDLGVLQILRVKFNQALNARGTQHTSRFAAVLFDHSQAGHFGGAAIVGHELLILPPSLNFDACVKDRNFGCTVVFINPDSVYRYYLSLTGAPFEFAPQLRNAIRTSRHWAERLATRTEQLLTMAANGEVALGQRQFRDAMRDEILRIIAQSLEGADPSGALIPRLRFAKARRLVRQAEEYILERPDARVRLVDLCQHADVSERTLQYAFREVLAMTPIHYLNQVRLHQVRRGLSSADPLNTTVSAEACRWGFLHFGEFTQAYKALFGELPSRTLNRYR